MRELFFWTVIVASPLLLGGLLGYYFRLSHSISDLFIVFTGEVLATAVGFSLIDTARLLVGNVIIGAGIIAGALFVFLAVSQADAVARKVELSLIPLGMGTLGLNLPEFIAIGVGLAGSGIALTFFLAVCISNLVEAYVLSVVLRQSGYSVRRVYLFWLPIIGILMASAILTFVVSQGSSETFQALIQAVVAGGMIAALSATEPSESFSGGLLGFMTSLRFGLAFLIASAPLLTVRVS
jgi:ZIP family zinc transporter